jgi:F-type H+-transporting ATPase subunit b
MPQLDPTWFASQIFWLVACFSLLYLLISRLILPPLSGTIAKREQTVHGDIGAAQLAKNSAERARLDYERTLSQSREMAQVHINEVLEENKRHAEETMRALDKEIAKKLTEATTRINNKKHELLAGLTPAAAEFAAMIAEKITQKPVSTEQTSRAVMEMIKSKDAA